MPIILYTIRQILKFHMFQDENKNEYERKLFETYFEKLKVSTTKSMEVLILPELISLMKSS